MDLFERDPKGEVVRPVKKVLEENQTNFCFVSRAAPIFVLALIWGKDIFLLSGTERESII